MPADLATLVPPVRTDPMQLLLAMAFVLTAVSPPLSAQCGLQWLPGDLPGADQYVTAVTSWDPDGGGPRPTQLVVGGVFEAVVSTPAPHIATLNPASGTWESLGTGMDGHVWSLAALPNGDLVAGGAFALAGGGYSPRIARWNGTNWVPFGIGMDGQVRSLVVMPNGDLVAGGSFTSAGGTAAPGIARWNGTGWVSLSTGMSGGAPAAVTALAVLPNGDLVAGGVFASAGGANASNIARWDGSAWNSLGTGTSGPVAALAVLPNGDLVAAGAFTTAGGVAVGGLARWSGGSWSAVARTSPWGTLHALAVLPGGDLLVGGSFSGGSVARWDGATWNPLGTGIERPGEYSAVYALAAMANGDAVAGGYFTRAGGLHAQNLATWDGAAWSAFGTSGLDGEVRALAVLPNGHLVALGSFTLAGGAPANRVARFDGVSWAPLGSGLPGGSELAVLPNGDLVVAGLITAVGGRPSIGFARWDGAAWTPFGGSTHFSPPLVGVATLAVLPNGDLVVGGRFGSAGGVPANNIARWNGSGWVPLGGGLDGSVTALALLPNGDLVAGGTFLTAGGVAVNGVARWDGSAWNALGSGFSGPSWAPMRVDSLAVLPNGDLVAAGAFTGAGGVPANSVARWDGSAWHALDTGFWGTAHALVPLPDGNLIAAGNILWIGAVTPSTVVQTRNIARWDGTSWSTFGPGLNERAFALAVLPDGDVVVGGRFTSAGSMGSGYWARMRSSCLATASRYGAGCSGSAGRVVLRAPSLPWVGATIETTAKGIAPNALAFGLFGWFATATPLVRLHPAAGPGCSLLTSQEAVRLLIHGGGVATSRLAIPNAAFLVGTVLHHQVLQVEFSPSFQVTSLSSSNGLSLVIGAL